MIKLISIEAVKKAFLKGIDSFTDLYEIQNNKNHLNLAIGNLMLNIKGQGVHINEITIIELEKVNRIKAILNRDSDEELKKLFIGFGRRLNQISQDKCKRCFITTHYSFIALSVLHYASVIDSKCLEVGDVSVLDLYDMDRLLGYYLLPDTRHKKVILKLFKVIGNTLENINTSLHEQSFLDQVSIDQISESEKLWAFICQSDSSLKTQAKDFLDYKSFKKFSDLGKRILKEKSFNDFNGGGRVVKFRGIPEDSDLFIKINELFSNTKDVLKGIDNMCSGILAYALKFKQNTSNLHSTAALLKSFRETYISGEAIMQRDTLSHLISKGITFGVLKPILSSSIIALLITSITGKTLNISFNSPYYGVWNRHGITGQIRAFLLKNYLEMFSIFIENHLYFVLSQAENSNISIQTVNKLCLYGNDFIKKFTSFYKGNLELLPNKKQKGSLYFYLKMYAGISPDGRFTFEPDFEKIECWDKSKLSKIYRNI
ncbi:hypothetical protein IB642_04770 [Allofrancisella guangzhouensis]|uniref:Uncharacterized protein n=1 Tax=Allofrancisella guangzhouensis TaxID=594679 RepID=A0A0A8E280_9GAMM|nr:hypothetical protein [Allofrancisella guangzhouensis]AJC48325.1 hypothetical protein SD28_00925 [Allofrancisella guangzhouensis]MBK2026587.1 hypothetical protein [Allofrancisella guangzhouensis]MBK2044331.1 hypothetical protein [Allofrancisella guangzhouensis]MBK2045574.1 hypothetical protein [Allofrancisella guangzhouensis]